MVQIDFALAHHPYQYPGARHPQRRAKRSKVVQDGRRGDKKSQGLRARAPPVALPWERDKAVETTRKWLEGVENRRRSASRPPPNNKRGRGEGGASKSLAVFGRGQIQAKHFKKYWSNAGRYWKIRSDAFSPRTDRVRPPHGPTAVGGPGWLCIGYLRAAYS
jgi:hypothetical protein